MNKQEFQALLAKEKRSSVLVDCEDLLDITNRTLLYGYTCDRDTWHVYIQDGVIYTVIYTNRREPLEQRVTRNEDFVPNKRLYPESCDLEFCELLLSKGVRLPFTTFNENADELRKNGTHYSGLTL